MRDSAKTRRYLNKVRLYDEKIRQKQEEISELKALVTSIGAIRYDKDRIVSSPEDKQSETIVKYVMLEQELERAAYHYLQLKKQIIDEIHRLDNLTYVRILHKRYIEYDKYDNIFDMAEEMGYSYDYLRHLFAEAIKEFGRVNGK